MLDRLLQTRLEPVVENYRRRQLALRLAKFYAGAVLVGLALFVLCLATGWRLRWLAPVLVVAWFAGELAVRFRTRRHPTDVRDIAREIEREHPRLQASLLTAVEQQKEAASTGLGYLQERVVREALEHNRRRPWGHRSYQHLFFARAAHWGGLTAFLFVLAGLFLLAPVRAGLGAGAAAVAGVEVTPGDVDVERGDGVVVLARFEGHVPAEASLVIIPSQGETVRFPLARNLDDPVFGGRIPEVTGDLTYRVDYEGKETRDFGVKVYDLPRLERADAHLEYPEYTGLEKKTIENTRRVSAVEGTRVRYELELNKPVASAVWIGRDRSGIELSQDAVRSNVVQLEFTLDHDARYALQLTDEAGRTNRAPDQFVLEVFTNRAPELKLVLPRGDDRVSPLEEVLFRGRASDDFGLRSYGLGYQFGAGDTQLIEFEGPTGRHEPREFERVVSLETLAAQPGQLLTYFLWADDAGPDGAVRRNYSDIYFLEVRPFDEIFRENQSGEPQSAPGSQGQQESPAEKLTELQKQIITATWTLRRQGLRKESTGFVNDTRVVHQSQEHAWEQAGELGDASNDPGAHKWVETARTEMQQAMDHLEKAATDVSAEPLETALRSEQSAYEALLRLQTREYQIAQGQRGQGRGSRSGRMQRQLNQLQLKASEDRYENQQQAAPQVDEQQREQLQFLARLKELAQRQQDLNQRLRELELALQEARTEQEREDLRRQLRRLRDQQQQMLSDVDELRQRMDRPDNQSETAEARRQLEETRSQLQRASEAMDQGAVSQAVASGTRASQQLEQLREDFRTKNASQFSEAMRQMRGQARDLVEHQEELARQMSALTEKQRPSLSDAAPREELARQAAQQTAGLTNLLDQVRSVTEESEVAEPLLSRDLYETFREAVQGDSANLRQVMDDLLRQGALTRPVYDMLRYPGREGPGQTLATTERLLREGELDAAQQLERKARADLARLQQGIDRAAEKILGDDTAGLELARSELDQLLEQLNQEISEGRGGKGDTNTLATSAGQGTENDPGRSPGDNPGQDEQREGTGQAKRRPTKR